MRLCSAATQLHLLSVHLTAGPERVSAALGEQVEVLQLVQLEAAAL